MRVHDVGQVRVLEHAVRHVHPQARDAAVQPEPDHVLEQGGNVRVAPVPVGLAGVEQVQVPLPRAAVGLGHPGPGGAAELRFPVVRRLLAVRPAPVTEDEPGPLRAAGRSGQRGAEQRMGAGAVVRHQVDDDPDLVRGGVLDQAVEVRHGPEQRIHRAVVADVVTAVGQRRRVEGGQPDGVHAEVGQVPQPGPQPRQVTHAVAVRVGEAARVHLVDDRVLPPHVLGVAHAPPSSRRFTDLMRSSPRPAQGRLFSGARRSDGISCSGPGDDGRPSNRRIPLLREPPTAVKADGGTAAKTPSQCGPLAP